MAYSREQKIALLRYHGIDESRIDALTDGDFDDLLRRAGGNMPTIEGDPTENRAENAEQVQQDYEERVETAQTNKIAQAEPVAQSEPDPREQQVQQFYNSVLSNTGDRTLATQSAARFSALLQEGKTTQQAMEIVAAENAPQPEAPAPTPEGKIAVGTGEDSEAIGTEAQQIYQMALDTYGDPERAGQASRRYIALRNQGMGAFDAQQQMAQEFVGNVKTEAPAPKMSAEDQSRYQGEMQQMYDTVLADTGDTTKATQAASRYVILRQQGLPIGDVMRQVAQEFAPQPEPEPQKPEVGENLPLDGGTYTPPQALPEGWESYTQEDPAGNINGYRNTYTGEITFERPTGAALKPEDGASSLDNPAPGTADNPTKPPTVNLQDTTTPTTPTQPTQPPAPAKISDADQFNADWANLNEEQRVEVFNSKTPEKTISGFKRQPDPETGTWKAPATKKPALSPTAGQNKIVNPGGTKIVADGEKPDFTQPDPANKPTPFDDTPDTGEGWTEPPGPAKKPVQGGKIGMMAGQGNEQPGTGGTTTNSDGIQTYKPKTALSDQLQTYFQNRIGQGIDQYGPSDDYIQRRKALEQKRISEQYEDLYDNVKKHAINTGVYSGDANIAGQFGVMNDQLDRIADQGESIELSAMDRRLADRNTLHSQAMQFDRYDRELDRAISNDNWNNIEDLLTGILTGFDDLKDWWNDRDNNSTKPGDKEPGSGKGDPPIPPVVPPGMVGDEPPIPGGPGAGGGNIAPPSDDLPGPGDFQDPGNPMDDQPFEGGGPGDGGNGGGVNIPVIGGGGVDQPGRIVPGTGQEYWQTGVGEDGVPELEGDEIVVVPGESNLNYTEADLDQANSLSSFGDQNLFNAIYNDQIPDGVFNAWVENVATEQQLDDMITFFEDRVGPINQVGDLGDPDAQNVIDQLEGTGGRIRDLAGDIPTPDLDPMKPLFGAMGEVAEEGIDAVGEVIPKELVQQAANQAEPLLNELADLAQPVKNAINTAVDNLISGNMPNINIGDMGLDELGQSAMSLGVAWKLLNGDFSGAAKQAGMNAMWSWLGTQGLPVGPIQLAIASVPILRNVLSESKEQTVALPSYRVDPSQMDADLFGEIEYAILEGEKFGYDDLPQEQIHQMLMSGEIALPERDLRDMVSSIYGENTQLEDVVGNSEFLEAGEGRHGGYADPNYNVNSPVYDSSALRAYASQNPQRIENIRKMFNTQSGVGQGTRIAG